MAIGAVAWVATDRMTLSPGSLFESVLVPSIWRPTAIAAVGNVTEYTWTAQDGTKDEAIHIQLSQANLEAFKHHMSELGFALDQQQSTPPALTTWIKGDTLVQTDMALPCLKDAACERTIVVLNPS
jgi:hypothetical protein